MTPDSPQSPREELEARLTALLLGELSADEAAALRHTIEQDPELARLESQLKETIGLVRQAAASKDEKTIEPAASLQLSAERREKLLASFKTTRLEIPTKKPRRTFRLNRELLKLAAMVVALLLVGGVIVSYFTVKEGKQIFAGEGMLRLGLDLEDKRAASSPARVTTINGSEPGVLSFESSASHSASLYGVAPASGTRAGKPNYAGDLGAEFAADAEMERAKAQILAQATATRSFTPPHQPANPEPAKAISQLAKNVDRFRTTIALPTSSEAQPPDTTYGTSGVKATDSSPLGRGSSRADDFASAVTGGADKLQVETLGEEATVGGRSMLVGGASGFGGPRGYRGGGGGGFGSGRGPVAASNEKEAGRVSGLAGAGAPPPIEGGRVGDLAVLRSLGDKPEGNVRQEEPPVLAWGAVGGGTPGVGAAGGQSFGFGNNASPANKLPESATPAAKFAWFADTDVNGLAPAPAQPLSRRAAARPESVSGTAPAIAANPMAAVEPATGLPVVSTTAGKDSSRLGLWDTGVDATPPVVAAQPVPSPAKPAPSDAFGVPLNGSGEKLLYAIPQQGQGGQGGGASAAGLPVAGGVNNSEFQKADAPSRDGAVLAGDKDKKAGGVLESAEWLKARAEEQRIPSRPVRPALIPAETPAPTQKPDAANGLARDAAEVAAIKERMLAALATNGSWSSEILAPRTSPAPAAPAAAAFLPATIPAETPAPDQKPDATKAMNSSEDVNLLLKQPETKAYAVLMPPPATPAPSTPAAAPVPALEAKEKNLTGSRTLNAADDLAETIELHNISSATNSFQSFTIANVVIDGFAIDPAKQATTYINGAVITDPTQGTGDGREWGFRQKLDADGDAKRRIDLLGDLTKAQPKTKDLAGIQNKLGNVKRGGAGGVYSADAVGYVNQTPPSQPVLPKPSPVVDKEQKKEREIVHYAFTTNLLVLGDDKGKKQLDVADDFTVTMSRIDGRLGGAEALYEIIPESAAKPPGQVNVSRDFNAWIQSKNVSEESLLPKSRVEIALPPGGENVQGVEREPRMQVGPVVINEINYNPIEKPRSTFAQRLNQTVNRAAGGSAEAASAGQRSTETAAEYQRLKKLSANLQSMNGDELKTVLLTGAAGPEAASVLRSLSEDATRRGIPAGEQFTGPLDERLEAVRANVKVKLERLEAELGGKQHRDLSRLKDANLSQVLDEYGQLSGRKVLAPGTLPATGGITVDTATALSDKEAINLLDTVLAMNQVATTFQGTDFVKVVPSSGTAQEAERFSNVASELLPEAGKVVTHVVQLKNALPTDLQQVIQPFAKMPGGIVTIPDSSMIVLRDKPENVSRMLDLIKKVDVVPVQEFIDVVIPLKTAPAADIARMLQSGAATGDLAVLGRTKIIADERNNSLLIVASRPDLSTISNAIHRLDAPIPQGEVEAADNAFSTFSLNVSDVSFKLAAASLEKGQMPDPATVRSEEFINAFDYRDPEPKGSAPIAFAWERARYPFAHNRDLVRFSVKTAASGRQPGRPLNLVLLLDNSGSMERADRVRVIHECIRVLTKQLQPEDRVSVVAFARTARLVVDGFSGSNASNLPEVIGQLAPDGGTNLEEAMRVAYETALKHFLPNGVNRVVLLTDGAANLGDVEPESLKKKVEAHRKQGVALDCFGIGWDGYNDDLLEVLSRNGDGRYGFVNTPEAAATEFAGQLAGALRVAASDVKVQVQFNPRRVTAWRQIGYAKHQLKKEQFRDNTVDAAEIGAAEQGNALYTVQVNPNGEGPLGVVRVRFKVPGTSDYREHEWAVPYSGAATPLEQSSAPMRLAATASAFSEWLVSSPFAGEVTPDRLLGYLSGVPETSAADPRPKKLEWMIRQAKSLSGK